MAVDCWQLPPTPPSSPCSDQDGGVDEPLVALGRRGRPPGVYSNALERSIRDTALALHGLGDAQQEPRMKQQRLRQQRLALERQQQQHHQQLPVLRADICKGVLQTVAQAACAPFDLADADPATDKMIAALGAGAEHDRRILMGSGALAKVVGIPRTSCVEKT